MKVLVSCADDACGTRLVVERTDPGELVEAECPGCGEPITASSKAQTTLIEAAKDGHRGVLETLLGRLQEREVYLRGSNRVFQPFT